MSRRDITGGGARAVWWRGGGGGGWRRHDPHLQAEAPREERYEHLYGGSPRLQVDTLQEKKDRFYQAEYHMMIRSK